MRTLNLIVILLFVAAALALAVSVITGESIFGFLLIFPFIIVSGPIAMIGSVLLVSAIILLFIGVMMDFRESAEEAVSGTDDQSVWQTEKKFGGVVMIGPVPIILGSDRKIANLMLGFAIAVLLVIVIMMLFLGALI